MLSLFGRLKPSKGQFTQEICRGKKCLRTYSTLSSAHNLIRLTKKCPKNYSLVKSLELQPASNNDRVYWSHIQRCMKSTMKECNFPVIKTVTNSSFHVQQFTEPGFVTCRNYTKNDNNDERKKNDISDIDIYKAHVRAAKFYFGLNYLKNIIQDFMILCGILNELTSAPTEEEFRKYDFNDTVSTLEHKLNWSYVGNRDKVIAVRKLRNEVTHDQGYKIFSNDELEMDMLLIMELMEYFTTQDTIDIFYEKYVGFHKFTESLGL